MKRIIKIIAGAFFTGLLLITASCKKDSVPVPVTKNTAAVYLNASAQSVDSVTVNANTTNGVVTDMDISIHLNHSTVEYLGIGLGSPSYPGYTVGSVVNIAAGNTGIIYQGPAYDYRDYANAYPAPFTPTGTFTITKNDLAASRLEGKISGCVGYNFQTSPPRPPITIDCNFSVKY